MKRTIVIAAMILMIAACKGPDDWSQADVEHRNDVDWVLIDHHVMFEPGQAALNRAQRDQLASFLDRHAVDSRDRIFIDAGYGDDRLTTARRALVERELRRRDLDPQADEVLGAGRFGGDHVTVSIGRYVVTPAGCPDWRKPPGYDPNNTPSSNFGCITEANLGLMVADPRDLVVGKAPGPAEGQVNARGVSRYRAGRVGVPDAPSTTGGGN